MTSKERLQEYIDKDESYQNFQKGNRDNLSDFDMFCIGHCEDIRTILAQYETLKSKFEAVLEENQKANATIDTNLELIDYLEKQIKLCSANDKFLVENGIISKQHKEIKKLEQELSETEGKLKRCRKKKQQVEDKCSYYKWIIEKSKNEIDKLEESIYKSNYDYIWVNDELEGIKNILRGELNGKD